MRGGVELAGPDRVRAGARREGGGAAPPPQTEGGATLLPPTEQQGGGAHGVPLREETESSVHSAPSSPALSATSTSSSPLLQIKQQARHVRTSSFQRFRQQMQRAWKWGPIGGGERSPREQLLRTTMNIEAMTNQKRQWYQIHSKAQQQPLSSTGETPNFSGIRTKQWPRNHKQ